MAKIESGHVNQREIEKKISSHPLRNIKRNLFTVLKNDPKTIAQIMPALFKAGGTMNNNKLHNSSWVYEDRFFNGKNINYDLIDFAVKYDPKSFPDYTYILRDRELMKLLVQRPEWLKFNAVEEARKRMLKLNDARIEWWVQMSSESKHNLLDAARAAHELQLPLVMSALHLSNDDAPAYDYFIDQELGKIRSFPNHNLKWSLLQWWYSPNGQPIRARFLCGAYMYVDKWVRPYTPSFDTLFVIWKKYVPALKERFDREKIKRESEQGAPVSSPLFAYQKLLLKQFADSPKDEISVMFSYGTRLPETNGLGESIDDTMGPYYRKKCIFIPVWMDGPQHLRPIDKSRLGGYSQYFTKQEIIASVGPHRIGWEKNLDEVHQAMKDVHDDLFLK